MQVGMCERGTFVKGVFKMFKEAQEKVGGNPTMVQQSFIPDLDAHQPAGRSERRCETLLSQI